MAISSYQAYLLRSTDGSAFTKVCDIKDFPDLGGAPEKLETTTLSDNMQTYILGIQSLDALEFKANYDSDTYDTIKGYYTADVTAEADGTPNTYAICLGASTSSNTTTYGANGVFKFKGQIDVYVNGAGVNEVVEMTLSVAPSKPIEKSSSTIQISG